MTDVSNPFSYEVGSADFQSAVIDKSREVPVIVDFWAPWCGPCRQLKPVLEKLAAEYAGRFILAKVNSDENPELAASFGVRGIPNVKAIKDGELVDEFSGTLPERQVRAFIEAILPSPGEPLRLAALQALAEGRRDAAARLMGEALAADPGHELARLDLAELRLEAGALDEAKALLDAIAGDAKDARRYDALQARAQLAAAGSGVDAAELGARIEADPADSDARLKLANALALRDDYRPAMQQLLEIVKRDRKFQDDAARKTLLTLFDLLGAQPEHDALVREFRTALARLLN